LENFYTMLCQQCRGGTSYTHIAHYEPPVLTSTSKEGASLGTRPLHGEEILVKLAYIKNFEHCGISVGWIWLVDCYCKYISNRFLLFFFSPQMHLRKQHGELEWYRDWDMTFARPGYFAVNPNAIYTYHHMGRPPDPQTSWAQAMTCFSNL